MSDKSPAGPASSPPPEPARSGVSRPVGLGITAATALIVFVVGSAVFPASKPPEQAAVVVAPPPPPPLPPPPPVTPEAGADPDAAAPEAGAPEVGTDKAAKIATAEPEAGEATAADAEPPPKKKKSRKDREKDRDKGKEATSDEAGGNKRDNAVLPPSDGTATPPSEAASADCALPEKDMAREAFRRNWPTVCPVPSTGKAFILIPIAGAIEGETHELRRKPKREARVTLPAGAESQLTMKQYKVKKLGFKELLVSNTAGGARLRVKLDPGAGDPVFEIKDGYAKITVAAPTKD